MVSKITSKPKKLGSVKGTIQSLFLQNREKERKNTKVEEKEEYILENVNVGESGRI